DRSGALRLVARTASPAPGTFDVFSFLQLPEINKNGQVAFLANLSGLGVNNTTKRTIWSEGSGSLTLIARGGNSAPNTGPGVIFDDTSSFGVFFAPAFNDAGKIAFQATLSGTGVTASNRVGYWSDASGALTLLLRDGDQAPDMSPGVKFLTNSLS